MPYTMCSRASYLIQAFVRWFSLLKRVRFRCVHHVTHMHAFCVGWLSLLKLDACFAIQALFEHATNTAQVRVFYEQ